MSSLQVEPLGFLGVHSVELCVFNAKPWVEYFIEGFGFQLVARSTAEHEAKTGYATQTLQCADVRVILLESRSKGSDVDTFLKLHPEGIICVNLQVKDIEHVIGELDARYAAFLYELQTDKVGDTVYKHIAVATPLGDVNFRFVEIDGDPNAVPGQEVANKFNPDYNPLGIVGIDHLTSNTRTLQPLITWFELVLGLERFWDVEFHTEDLKPGTGTGLRSIVVWDPDGRKIKLANNEPLKPRFNDSQIQQYVNDNHGPGIQHIAFRLKNLIPAVEWSVATGKVNFLSTPKTYYEMVPERIKAQKMGAIAEPLEELERLHLLIDGEEGGYLLQIFCQDQASQFKDPKAGPLFIELIQREGSESFGEGNFRALFESIEREQRGA